MQISTGFQTLSTNNPNNYDAIEGLFYVPDVSQVAACNATYSQNIPSNVTTAASFPSSQQYPLIAIFPWSSVDCVEAFLTAARADAVRAAITFQPNVTTPPSPGDYSWSLQDTGHWRSDNQYPIYAVSSTLAVQMLTQLGLYSGNMTSAPNGAILASQYDSRDFPRLFTRVNLQNASNVPSLWIFLIIVLAVLLGIVIVASIVMHLVQRRQRSNLQRRLERGEVDLETLGIKKMNVPQEKIDEMPKYTFTADPDVPAAVASPNSNNHSSVEHHPSFSQTTCPICIDDFIPNETTVRELPCKHIFHPECIDLFLRDNSSLCPLCKTSALPAGYCPIKVTNLMVRRERLVRRMRERRRQSVAAAIAQSGGSRPPATRAQAAGLWFQRRLRVGAGTPTASATPPYVTGADRVRSEHQPASQGDVELGPTASTASHAPAPGPGSSFDTRRNTIAVPPEIAARGAAARRAWRRERLARQQDEAYNQQAETARRADVGRPLWRRVVGRIAPGLD